MNYVYFDAHELSHNRFMGMGDEGKKTNRNVKKGNCSIVQLPFYDSFIEGNKRLPWLPQYRKNGKVTGCHVCNLSHLVWQSVEPKFSAL